MRKLLVIVSTLVLASGIGFATEAFAASPAPSHQSFTCVHFQDPTVELVWSHACHF